MIPVLVKDILPCANLQEYVRKYQVFRFVFDKQITPPIKYHYPRPEHCITFYIRDAQKFRYSSLPTIQPYPQCVINGMHTVPVYRYAGTDFLAIKAILRPSVLYHLVKLPLNKITNTFINAEDIWGNEICLVCDRLKELDELTEMITVIENFIENLIKKIKNDCHPIDNASDYILNEKNDASINWLANQSCLNFFTTRTYKQLGRFTVLIFKLIK